MPQQLSQNRRLSICCDAKNEIGWYFVPLPRKPAVRGIDAETAHGLAVYVLKQNFVRCDDDDEVMDATPVLETEVFGHYPWQKQIFRRYSSVLSMTRKD